MKVASVLGSLSVAMSMVVAMAGKKKTQEPLNREMTPFWLRDKADGEPAAGKMIFLKRKPCELNRVCYL